MNNQNTHKEFPRRSFHFERINTQKCLNTLIGALESYAHKNDLYDRLTKISYRLNGMDFKIAIVANISSGKSSFINALFGDNILPAFHEATTDCATYIYDDGRNTKKSAHIYFEDDKEDIQIPAEDIKDEIKLYAAKDTDKDEKYKNVDHIDLYWRFDTLKGTGGFQYTFIDTPGPNNTGEFQEKHKSITNKLIRENADLVLFLFDYGQLDANLSSDEQGLWEIIKNRSQTDPFFDVLFIINKIDLALEDDEKKGCKIGTSKEKAIAKLKKTALGHGFLNPKVLGVSSHLGCLCKMHQKGLLSKKSLDYGNHFKAYKKALIDFEDYDSPEEALYSYSEIATVEKKILEYITTTIEKKVVSRVKWEVEGLIKEIENAYAQKISILSQNKDEALRHIKKGIDFLNRTIPVIENQLLETLNSKRYMHMNRLEQLIEESAEKKLIINMNDIIYKSCYSAFFYLELNMNWKEARRNSEKAQDDKYPIFDPASQTYQFKTKNKTLTPELLFSTIEAFVEERLNDNRQNTINEYKLSLVSIYNDIIIEFNGIYSKIHNELIKSLSQILGKEKQQLVIHGFDKLNVPPLKFEIPISCIESTEKSKVVSVPDGYKTMKIKKLRQTERSWYNPLRWVGLSHYNDEYVETKKKIIYKTRSEKEYVITINATEILSKLSEDLKNGVKTWKKRDTQQFYLSVDAIIEHYLKFLEEVQTAKKNEIIKLKEIINRKESNLDTLKVELSELRRKINASIQSNNR